MTDTATAQLTADILLDIQAVHIRPEQPFTFTSGRLSPVYVDCRKIISFPRARAKLMDLGVERVCRDAGHEAFDVVAGGETAGIPFAAFMSERLGLPMTYIRKKPKGFGRNAQIEGDFKDGARMLLVEDLASEGGSKHVFLDAINAAGAVCRHIFVIFNYGTFPEGIAALEARGVKLHALATWADVLIAAERRGYTKDQLDQVRSFLTDPDGWAAKRKSA
ncbi:MAG: orotate phosphoribosyltransferase [Alphaproteobacteria bacterium]|nr:orotate phosphoribosyltransferase [Alphaproteobacteria bacterium]